MRLTVAHLRLHLDHLYRRRRLGGDIDGDKLDGDILRHLDHVGLLGHGDLHLDHLGGPGVIVVVVLVLVVVVVGKLNWSRVLLRLRRVNWSTYWCTIAVNIGHREAGQQEGEDLGYRGYR